MSYEPIENYGIIGDCHGCALISSKGNIDWLTFERFDSDPLLWSILDDTQGSSIGLDFPPDFFWKRSYRKDTNILETTASNHETQIKITDYMPVGRKFKSTTHDYTKLKALHALVRKIQVVGKSVRVKITKRFNSWPDSQSTLVFLEGKERLSFREESSFDLFLVEGSCHYLVISQDNIPQLSIKQLQDLEKITNSFWSEWISYSQYTGNLKGIIDRSALTLKMLIHAPTGAIMAAPTTSLPENFGGQRNWDYRYSWIRDSVFTLYALGYLGYSG
nr:hypothetical protein [Bdellovibrionales bacterium]